MLSQVVLKKFSSHKLYPSFAISQADKYTAIVGVLTGKASWEKSSDVNIERVDQWRSFQLLKQRN